MYYNFVSLSLIHHKRNKLDYITLFPHMRRFTSTLQAWHKIVLFSAHVQINLEKLITSS